MPIEKSEKHKADNKKRILVVGDVNGQFTKLYQRLKNVNDKAGPFHYVICVGNFFSIEDEDCEDANLVYIAKEFKDSVPMPIYVLGPTHASQRRYYKPLFKEDLRGTPTFEEGFDIALNVNYVGRKGVLTTVDELKIAYLSGLECEADEASTDYTFTSNDIEQLTEICSSSRIDVLMTSAFPYNVNEHSYGGKSEYYLELCKNGSLQVSKLARSILPRYHFVPSEKEFFEREPYRNHLIAQEQPKLVTRFVSIAAVPKTSSKQKWVYAFNIVPARWLTREEVSVQPDDATESPYSTASSDSKPKPSLPEVCSNGQFFFQQPPPNDRNRNLQRYPNDNRNQQRYPNDNRELQRYPMNDNQSRNQMNDRNQPRDSMNNNRNQSWNPMNDGRNQQRCLTYDVRGPSRSSAEDSFESSSSSNGPCKRERPSGDQMEEDKRPRLTDSSCWFCLSSAHVEKHLIVSIGDRAYLALAKGNIVEHHFLILPIGHYRSINEIESNPDLDEVNIEIGRFKNALIDYLGAEGRDKVAVFYERNYKSGHLQLQCIGVPRNKAAKVETVLKRECSNRDLSYWEIPRGQQLNTQISQKVPYFYLEVQGKRFVIGIKLSRGFPMQFGRELLCDPDVLNCPTRVDWRECELTEDAAKKLVGRVRKEFGPYDFTM